jgi:antitoxin (DNA-binding transcriptional repressor) of toxin-antitoxin stability system
MFEVSIEKSSTVQLPDLIDSVVNGEEVVFTQNNQPIARLVAVRQEKPRPQFGSAQGLFTMAKDFNEPLEDFGEYQKWGCFSIRMFFCGLSAEAPA